MRDADRSHRAVGSDVIARRVADALSKSGTPLHASDIAEIVGIPRADVKRALERLQKLGFAERDVASGEWDVGVEVLRIASAYLRNRPLHRIGRSLLPDAARRTGRTSHIAICDKTDVVYLDEEQPLDGGTGLATEFGTRRPAILTAVGQAILADATDNEVDRHIAIHAAGLDPKRVSEVRASIDRCRTHGIAMESGLTRPGVACLAAPVRDRNGRAIASLGVTFVGAQATRADVDSLATAVAELASRFSELLGWDVVAVTTRDQP